MKAYRYNSENKKYEGEATCQIDPLESEMAGKEIYLLPGDCTYEVPPEEKEGFDIIFNGAGWEYKEQEKKPEDKPYVPTEKDKTQQAIYELKYKLSETDYKIIKCSEASMSGEEMPYDLAAVIEERDAWRAEINELEAKLVTLE